MLIKTVYSAMLHFLKNPKDELDSNQTISHKFSTLFFLLILDFIIMAILLAPIGILEEYGLVDTENHSVYQLLENYPIFIILLLAVLLLPFIEELVFRLYLRYNYNIILRVLHFFASLKGEENKIRTDQSLQVFWNKWYRFIFYFSALVFAVIHLANFEDSSTSFIIIPLIIAPQFFMGILLAYMRVRFGFIYGFLMHAIHNLILVGVVLISMSIPIENIEVINKSYQLKIEESSGDMLNSNLQVSQDSIVAKEIELKSLLADILGVSEFSLKSNQSLFLKKKLNINLVRLDRNIELDSVLINQLQAHLKFVIDSVFKETDAWELQIQDEVLLEQYRANSDSYSSHFNSSNDSMIFTNTRLKVISQILSEEWKKSIFYRGQDSSSYDFRLLNQDMDGLVKTLDKLGLKLNKTKQKSKLIEVNFN